MAKVGEEVFVMAGPEVRDAAVQGSQEIVDALVGARLRFTLYLVQIPLKGEPGNI